MTFDEKPVAYMKIRTWVTPDSPNGPAEYDEEVEFMEASELADTEGWIALYRQTQDNEALVGG